MITGGSRHIHCGVLPHSGTMRASKLASVLLLCAGAVCLCGCGEFFNRKSTEIESRAVLNELSKVRENPNVSNPMPELYQGPARRMAVDDGVKVFYFAKNCPVIDLAANIKEVGFTVSSNPSTNQVILHCPDDEQADKAIDYLERLDVAPIQVNIDCLILERFGDVTKDWETTMLIQNLFGESITVGENKFPDPIFPGASLRESRRSEFGLDIGYWDGENGHKVRFLVDMLESRGYLKVLLNPTLETVNGKAAKVEIRDKAPIPKTVSDGRREPYTLTDYQWVADSVEVTPSVYSDGTIGLATEIIVGSKSKPEGVTQISIITQRSIKVAENRIDPGKSLIIGGMRKSENRSVVRGAPFLKDLPLVGFLFSSKDFEEKATEIIFILTPSVSSNGAPYTPTADMVREKYRSPGSQSDLGGILSDPFGTDVYTQYVNEQARKAEAERVRTQRDAEEAERLAASQRQYTEQTQAEAQRLQEQARQAEAAYEKALREIQQSRASTQAMEQQGQAQQERIGQLELQMQQSRTQAEQATRDAQAAARQAQEAQSKARAMEDKASQAKQTEQKARQELEEAQKKIKQIEQQSSSSPPSPGAAQEPVQP